MLAETLIVSENEGLVFNNGTPSRAAELISSEMRFGSSGLIKEVVRIEGAVPQEFENCSVKAVGAGLRNYGNLASRAFPVFSAVRIRQNVKLAYGIDAQQLPADAAGRYIRGGDARVLDTIQEEQIKVFTISGNDKIVAL